MKLIRCSITAAGLAFAGCGDGQAGSDYRGEPLMAMNGVVTSATLALTEDLVPALVFLEWTDPMSLSGPNTTHFVKGDVEGTFPSAFTLRIYDAPAAPLVEALLDGEPAFAMGYMTAVSPEHPAWLRTTRGIGMLPDGSSGARNEVCSPSQCISSDPLQCPSGQYDPNAEWPCGARFPNNLPWTTYGQVQGYRVLYVAGPAPAGGVLSRVYAQGNALAAGYHLIDQRPEVLQGVEACTVRADQRAVETLNLAGGKDWSQEDLHSGEAWDLVRKHTLAALAAENCSLGRLVDTSVAPVELALIDQPTRQVFGL